MESNLINWIRTTNQSGAAMLYLKEQVEAGQPLNELQLAYARRMQRTENKRRMWKASRERGYAA
ncbi:MAG: hypothetical protein KGL39_31580 [Patescibacteria group bacterium]|nr:hypothetical protein [Patescibacteria group bacterium]